MKKTLRKIGFWLALPFLIFYPGKEAKALPELPPVSKMTGSQEAGEIQPLYLEHFRHVHGDDANLQYAGHRSHSSHRSHASHSSHASHYSSSGGTYTPAPAAPPERLTPSASPPAQTKAGSVEPTADEMIKQGMAASQAGRYEEAINVYKKIIAKDSANFIALNNLGVTQFKAGNRNGAQESLRRAIEIKEDYPDCHYNLAIVLQESGKHEEAQAEFKKACELGVEDACKMIAK